MSVNTITCTMHENTEKYYRIKDAATDIMDISLDSGVDYELLVALVDLWVKVRGKSFEEAVELVRREFLQ